MTYEFSYGCQPLKHEIVIETELLPARWPYLGPVVDFITHPLVWNPMWIGAAILAWRTL